MSTPRCDATRDAIHDATHDATRAIDIPTAPAVRARRSLQKTNGDSTSVTDSPISATENPQAMVL